MKKYVLLSGLIACCSIAASYAQNVPNAWNYVGNMYPHPDSTRIGGVGFATGSSGYIGTGAMPNSAGYYKDFYRLKWDPVFQLDVWSPIADFPFGTFGAVGFAIGGYGYVLTAHQTNGVVTDQKLYKYDTLANTWSAGVQFPGTARIGMTCFVVNGKAYVCTGSGGAGMLSEVWEYNPTGAVWTQKNNFPGPARMYASSFAIGNKGYLGTGTIGNNTSYNDFWEYEPTTDTWTQKAPVPGPGRFAAAGVAAGNRGYITMGSAGAINGDTWEYNPVSNSWVMKQQFPGVSRSYTAFFSSNGRAYVGTGVGDNHNTIWAFRPGQMSVGNLNSFQYCQDDTLSVPYTTNGLTFQAGNSFIAEMDYGTLTFASPTVIGSISSTQPEGIIPCHIPANALPFVSGYKVRVRSTNAAFTGGTNALNLSINAIPPQPTITQVGNVLTSSSAQGYQWYNAGGAIPGATNQSYTFTASGTYYVKVTTDGCSSIASLGKTVTYNSIAEIDKNIIALYPNPASDVLHVQLAKAMTGIAQVRILNCNGQMVKTLEYSPSGGTDLKIPVASLSTGVYILELTDATTASHQQFVVQ